MTHFLQSCPQNTSKLKTKWTLNTKTLGHQYFKFQIFLDKISPH